MRLFGLFVLTVVAPGCLTDLALGATCTTDDDCGPGLVCTAIAGKDVCLRPRGEGEGEGEGETGEGEGEPGEGEGETGEGEGEGEPGEGEGEPGEGEGEGETSCVPDAVPLPTGRRPLIAAGAVGELGVVFSTDDDQLVLARYSIHDGVLGETFRLEPLPDAIGTNFLPLAVEWDAANDRFVVVYERENNDRRRIDLITSDLQFVRQVDDLTTANVVEAASVRVAGARVFVVLSTAETGAPTVRVSAFDLNSVAEGRRTIPGASTSSPAVVDGNGVSFGIANGLLRYAKVTVDADNIPVISEIDVVTTLVGEFRNVVVFPGSATVVAFTRADEGGANGTDFVCDVTACDPAPLAPWSMQRWQSSAVAHRGGNRWFVVGTATSNKRIAATIDVAAWPAVEPPGDEETVFRPATAAAFADGTAWVEGITDNPLAHTLVTDCTP